MSWSAWTSDERRQILEEAAERDHVWGVRAAEAEPTNDPKEWLNFKQPSLSRDEVRYHVEVHASHREQRWETGATVSVQEFVGVAR